MATFKVKISFVDLSDSNLAAFAANVVSKLTNNKNFTFLKGELTNLAAASDDYQAKLILSTDGSRVQRTEKKTSKNVLIEKLRIVGAILNIQAAGDKVKLESSGFPLTAPRIKRVLIAPFWIIVRITNIAGELKIRVPIFKRQCAGIIVAFIEASIENDDPSTWTIVVAKRHTCILRGLKSRVLYRVCVSYLGSYDAKPIWSDIITIAPF